MQMAAKKSHSSTRTALKLKLGQTLKPKLGQTLTGTKIRRNHLENHLGRKFRIRTVAQTLIAGVKGSARVGKRKRNKLALPR